jgi:hypothetical protein
MSLLYPDRVTYDAMLDRRPGIAEVVGDAVWELGGGNKDSRAKK